MKRRLSMFSALAAVFLICACGGNGAEDTAEVLNGMGDVQAPDPEATLESAPDPRGEEPAALDVESSTTGSATFALSCSSACIKISSSNLTGQCCTCNGASKHYARSAWSYTTFLCS